MTEKRADYRKKQQQKKVRKIFDNFKRLKKDDQQVDEVDPEPTVKESANFESREDFSSEEERENRINRLKKRLNYAILIVVVLLIIVLFALFKL